MKHKLSLALILPLFLAACLPSITAPAPAKSEGAAPIVAPTSAKSEGAVPVQATSRGDQLVASDPSSVRVGTGKPTLIEFFRFT